ncbi:laminin subunit alpha-like [Uloborus diversus]|uniref:laminin subunit alpha-like n=1 Tax=Uloborus diversus TaxID=327109 RepID=UPI002409A107|nr:laminin subunit alpha-like [Uloborus diversus]
MSRTMIRWALCVLTLVGVCGAQVLNPPLFNLAEGRKISASATCGEGVVEPELYCKLVGANTDRQDNPNINLIQGQVCDFCDPNDPKRAHPPENAIDGTERWWQSPPLSRGNKFNEVNLTIDLGQEFHVAYVFIKMGNSPRPGVWVLERSTDAGETYDPWQYFADTPADCAQIFGPESLQPLNKDDSVICETKFSKVVPLEGGEIVVSLLNDRPNAENFSYSSVLQEWTKATNIRLRFLRTKTLLGHLMSVQRQDPTVTRRYFYSLKDINIGGRCVCNGHAETCDLTDLRDPYKLLCRCQHNTCGPQCEQCCPGFLQKKWRRAIINNPFVCEPCNCYGHSDECYYDEETDRNKLSLDIHGHYEGGGICKNCRHNTEGINCNRCKPTFYRPYGKLLNATDVCQPCNCDLAVSTGNCADGSGLCECRPEFLPPYCNDCNLGYYGYPECKLCDCHPNGTYGDVCEVSGGQCPCKASYGGINCDRCEEGYYGFPDCLPCNCNPSTSVRSTCDPVDGQCPCQGNYFGRQCDRCRVGYYNYPTCEYCNCDPTGCVEEICDSNTGACICKEGYGGPTCDRCAPGYYGYPVCEECKCNEQGSVSSVCDISGRCQCLSNYAGLKCDQCSPGYYSFPDCFPCDCEPTGSIGVSCGNDKQCVCRNNFDGERCDVCKEGFYNYPYCEECNCDPAGVLPTFLGCGSLTSGLLCECKERVTGRICNECKPLYWNLKASNPLGCEDCNCFLGGTVGGIAVCGKTNGQCLCKPNVGSRQCSQCKDGTFGLDSDDLFGCKDCGCDIGGSVNNVCDKDSGQCACRPRISGRRCDSPLQTHFFPTMFQHQFEIEDGRTSVGTQVRYGYEENVFPGFSWRGYAVFSDVLQKEVLLDIFVEKPSLYEVYFHYLNFGGENVYGTITFSPETFGDIQQSTDMVFEATQKPRLMKVSGKQGAVASPFVLNPGRWTVSIRIEKPLFLDYMVLLPQSYYEATLLQEDVSNLCHLNDDGSFCRSFAHPPLPADASVVRGEAGYVPDGDDRRYTNVYDNEDVLRRLKTQRMAWLDKEQEKLHLDFRLSRPEPHVMIITYHTPENGQGATATVELSSTEKMEKGMVTFYDCSYSFLCRQVVVDQYGEVAKFNLDSNYVTAVITLTEEANLAVDNVALVPADLWQMDYIVPQSLCVQQDESCIETEYPIVPESTKVEFESSPNENRKTTDLPEGVFDEDIGLVNLAEHDNLVDLEGSVPAPGVYIIAVHYYQPNHPKFDAKVMVQNGEYHDEILTFDFCPSVSGCRTVVHSKSTSDPTPVQLFQNFYLTIQQPENKTVWVDYVLVIPAQQFRENVLTPLRQDKAGKFITECGQNSFQLPSDVSGFCREAAFSLTSEYNNGALPCRCDTDGSLSYECEEFGGQCQCKPNVIGRTCSQCRTGYFGFPNCKPCDCPSTAYCQPVTGQCICPPRVTGDRCDVCVPYTYGFDPLIGCEECNCNPLGVSNGQLQCDLQTGQCRCRSNIVGRTCDKCKAGYWAFPHCQLCNCDLRGSTEDICEQDSARCYCKENVYGDSCDQCKPGTFYLEEVNPLGCTKCFCFGTTDRCSSGYFFKTQIYEMSNWNQALINVDSELSEVDDNGTMYLQITDNGLEASLPDVWPENVLFYFSAPSRYLGNKLTSYGGNLSYIMYTKLANDNEPFESLIGPDLILRGNNITIVHNHVEQPASGFLFRVNINLIEHEFRHIGGREVTREQMMMVLVNLERLLVRGSYFHPVLEISLTGVLMDTATEEYVADAPQALRVEQCQCPPSYMGSSCEECAPGYYRSKTGPYLSYCVPCQCYGHAQTCDVNTGKCINCQHNTEGDHCERCSAGYHGDSTQGTPYDCLICACPLPIESNNFAESCEVSPSGHEISCQCKPGYYGPRCEVCNVGYFGNPEVIGSKCQPCDCSGNIDPSQQGSCDSLTGDCILCLNNTFGAACELCAPGYHGDAVYKKDCKKCVCNECGTRDCDHNSGECVCWPNVQGSFCDQCEENHWGFDSCGGCRPCNCGPASRSEQCDLQTGQCDCQPGADGLTCDLCEPGYWQYSSYGCVSCNCDQKYSRGAVCNSLTGQCQCLPGVVGDKCDSCPYRWVFVKKEGCYECDVCVHGLLDTTDELHNMIEPVMVELKDASLSYFANRRLQNVNKTADTLRFGVDGLIADPGDLDYSPLVFEVQTLEKKTDQLSRNATHLLSQAETVSTDADTTRTEALEVENLIQTTIGKVQGIVEELSKLSEGLQGSLSNNLDDLLAQAEYILSELTERNFDVPRNATTEEYEAAEELLEHVKSFEVPVLETKLKVEEESKKVNRLIILLDELNNNSQKAYGIADDAKALEEEIQRIPVKAKIEEIEKNIEETNKVLDNATKLLDEVKDFIASAEKAYKRLGENGDRLLLSIRNLKDEIEDIKENIKEIEPVIEEAQEHSAFLMEQAALLEKSLADTRNSSDAAVQAAKAYGNIEEAINDAYDAAQAALIASEQATTMSDGVLDRTSGSKESTRELLDTAFKLEEDVRELKPRLNAAKDGVLLVAQQNGKTSRGLDIIKKELEKLPIHSLEVLAGHAANGSAIATDVAEKARRRIETIVDKLPEDESQAKDLPKEIEDAKQGIKAGHSYIDRLSNIVPDTNNLMDRAVKKESRMRIIGKDVSDKLAELQKKVAVARTQANRIKLGVNFGGDTVLQLRNPEGMQKAATYTHMSLYFNTTERFGLLAFVGNEKGTHNQMKRVLTDDYLALEIRGGHLVLVMDLGSGSQDIKHDTYVSDGKWHQAIVERTGKTCTLTVRSQDEPDAVVEGYLPGTYSVFNLDQKLSKFFIGGISDRLSLPQTIENYNFDGCIEEVEFGGTPVGLWDFVYAENNNKGCAERQELAVLVPSNGLKFSGSGYVILPRHRHQFGKETHIKMLFKTYAEEGLLFLIGKNKEFLALELEEGYVILKFNLGSGTAVLRSQETFNDGKWHSLEATRVENEGILKVDQVEVDNSNSPGSEATLSFTNEIYVGGNPGKHKFAEVSSVGFEGCIKDMQISAEVIDLNKNKEALGVVNGCPETIARTVSFSNTSTGYIAMPATNLEKVAQLTFKFKTAVEDGVIFYAANEDQSSHLYIGLHKGTIVMSSSPGGEIRSSPEVKYNDLEWHYVSATKTVRQMRLDIDDIKSVEIELQEDANVQTSTPMYFGGVPDGYTIEADTLPSYPPFVGCIGDTTVNNRFQNFADTQDKKAASLASCPLADPYEEGPTLVTEEPTDESFEPEIISTEPTVEEDTSPYPEGPEPTPIGQCALPLQPRTDSSVKPGDGIRFGNAPNSRQEFSKSNSFMASIFDESTFALEFRTTLQNGVMFYVAASNHIDFIGLLMQNGKIIYGFNCGSGSAVITSQNQYNDGTWHRVVFSRRGQDGRLVIDDEEVFGNSVGAASSVNLKSPFFIGGVSEEVAREAKNNLKGAHSSFPGCIRNVEAQGELLTAKKPSLTRNITGCSDKVEEGTFFSSEGGYLVLYDRYRVGQRVTITVDIKPRNLSGIIMAVHGRTDYLILQMIDGRVLFSVDNGAGAIRANYLPTDKHYLCDGQWHTIQVVKSNNVVTVSLDGLFSEPGIGIGGVSSTDTNDPLYIGGLPESSFSKRGVETTAQFVGCMRYVELDSKPQSLANSRVFGKVTLNTCPTI